MATLTFYNSLTRTAEPFRPIDAANVRVYSCGPTVYNYAHLGNLRAYVFTDTLTRVLRWKGYPLTHVINITDVGHLQSDGDTGDDKMEARARETGQDIWAIARHYTDTFKANLLDLNVIAPTHFPLATDHVPEMIAFGEAIVAKHCYRLDSGLYFDVSTVPDYGRLAGPRDDAGEGRIDRVAGKRHPQDFAIWRNSAPGENRQMEWDSPWGRGAPGWHLECSVMSRKYLGTPFDIHTGGIDHREIHHPNEIAQNQAYCGCTDTGAAIWMHNNFLVDRTGKMAKSSGTFLTLRLTVSRGHHPLAYRLMCLQAHYRSQLEFSWESLTAAGRRLKRLVISLDGLRARAAADALGEKPAAVRRAMALFEAAVSEDLNTAGALVALDSIVSDRGASPGWRLWAAYEMDRVLGLDLRRLTRTELRLRPADARIDEVSISARISERKHARATKDFGRSDAIRDELEAVGVEVMDGDPLGWDWRLA